MRRVSNLRPDLGWGQHASDMTSRNPNLHRHIPKVGR